MAVNSTIVAAALAASLQQGLPLENNDKVIQQEVIAASQVVKGGVETFLCAKLGTPAGLKVLKDEVTGRPILLAAADTGTRVDVGTGGSPVLDILNDTEEYEYYLSLSQEDKAKVNKFHDGLVNLADDNRKKKAINIVMVSFTRFIKAMSFHPGEMFGFAETSLISTIDILRRAGYPGELITGLESYTKNAARADSDFKIVRAEIADIDAKIKSLQKEIDGLSRRNAELDRRNAELDRRNAELDRVLTENQRKIEQIDRIIKSLMKTKELLSGKVA